MFVDRGSTAMSRVLVCGGAGYIGSHVTLSLLRSGYLPVLVDNFANSDPSVIKRLNLAGDTQIEAHELDLTDSAAVLGIFEKVAPCAVIQLAGLKVVEHSSQVPIDYYRTNFSITLNILSAMSQFGCKRIVFSSSATVYGDPEYLPINEAHPISPINPYGRTKYFQEEIIRDWVAVQSNASAVILRYFNPVGADVSGIIGEDPSGIPTNLMPIIAEAAAGRRPEVVIFGGGYRTRDGTCERDYIHVSDLAEAHVAAVGSDLEHLFEVFNVGTGKGVTVREAIDIYSKVLGRHIPQRLGKARAGDTGSSVAATDKIRMQLKWRPRRSFEDACRDDLKWRAYKSRLDKL